METTDLSLDLHLNLNQARNLSISLIYAVLMATSGFSKISSFQTPEWFVKPFQNTWIDRLPGGAKLAYWVIAILESVLAVGFLASIFAPALLPLALTGSLFLFCILCLGLRVTHEYQGSANMFIYFGTTLIAILFVSMNSALH
jgi:hypothetical protein